MTAAIDPTRILDEDHAHTNENYAAAAELYNAVAKACTFAGVPTSVRAVYEHTHGETDVLSAVENLKAMVESLTRGLERVRTVKGLNVLRTNETVAPTLRMLPTLVASSGECERCGSTTRHREGHREFCSGCGADVGPCRTAGE